MNILRCCYCDSASLRWTEATVKITQMSDIGGGDFIPITSEYPVLLCANCQSKVFHDVYGKVYPAGDNLVELDR